MHHFDSRKIMPGDTFICLPGGDIYIDDAKKRGAANIVKMTREEMAEFSNSLFLSPSRSLCVIGITGTNGKTTVAYWVSEVLKKLGQSPFFLGTINAALTTPESLDIQSLMKQHLDQGGTHFVMEVSSHGIAQHRIKCIDFNVKCLTNITQDHLDYHGSFDAYKKTKESFMKDAPGDSIFPEDFLQESLPSTCIFCEAFNQENLQATKAVIKALDYADDVIDSFLHTLVAPPGRFEKVSEDNHPLVIVDFAHTPDGFQRVLTEAKKQAKKRKGHVVCMFGCGGDRDKKKRPLMGKIASELCDRVIITQDNPRSEDPNDIVNDILQGIPHDADIHIENDRILAIKKSIDIAQKRDVVMLLGKGHETTQIIKDTQLTIDDRVIAKKMLQSWHENID